MLLRTSPSQPWPTDPDLVFAIFRNGSATQLLAGAELKVTQGGHQTAFADTGFGGGALANLPDLPSFLGGDGDDEDDTLPESIRRLRLHPHPMTTGGEALARPLQAPTPGAHHTLEGLTPTKAEPALTRPRRRMKRINRKPLKQSIYIAHTYFGLA